MIFCILPPGHMYESLNMYEALREREAYASAIIIRLGRSEPAKSANPSQARNDLRRYQAFGSEVLFIHQFL
jgi:hypothetical protein